MKKDAFTIIELILVIFLILLVSTYINLKQPINKLNLATNKLVLYLKQTRYQALIDDKYKKEDKLWHKKRWTLKFFRCSKSVGGIYYVIYSDENKKGHPSADEALVDSLSKQKIYSTNRCKENSNYSKYTLLTKQYEIVDVKISCNSTSSLGQISFGSDGKVYSKLSSIDEESNEYEIKKSCIIKLIDKNQKEKQIEINPKTSYIRAF